MNHLRRSTRSPSPLRSSLHPSALDDFQSIHEMLQEVVGALCSDTIDYRRASAMLTALRMASAELRNPTMW
jgi:hypothetical protein